MSDVLNPHVQVPTPRGPSVRNRWRTGFVVGAMVMGASVVAPGWAGPTAQAVEVAEFHPLPAPQRIADTRPGEKTVDGKYQAIGRVAGGTEMQLDVAGRAGVSAAAVAVTLNVTAVDGTGPGFLAIYPCGDERPNSSNVNYLQGAATATAVFSGLDASGKVCIFARTDVHVIVDVNGWMPQGVFAPLPAPQRLADTRPDGDTVDGKVQATGKVSGGTELPVQITGRGGMPDGVTTAVLNVTVTDGESGGFLAVYPCGEDRPNASNLNYAAGQVVSNAVVARLDSAGRTCVFARSNANVIVDVSGSLGPDFFVGLDAPQRIVDSRVGGDTVDGLVERDGFRRAGTTLEFPVTGRAEIPDDATAVVLNVTVTGGEAPGFVTLHPRNSPRPVASNVNYGVGTVNANLVVAGLGGSGKVCLFARSDVDVIVDVAGYYIGEAPVDTGVGCPSEFPIRQRWDSYPVGEYQMRPGRYVSENPHINNTWCEAMRLEGPDFVAFIEGGEIYGNSSGFGGRMLVDVGASDGFVSYSQVVGVDQPGTCTAMVPYVPVDVEANPPATSFESGHFITGQHLQPGTYRATTRPGLTCVVYLVSSFDGADSSKVLVVRSLEVEPVSFRLSSSDLGVMVGTGCTTFSQ